MVVHIFHRLEDPGADYYNPSPDPTYTALPLLFDYINNDPALGFGTGLTDRAQVSPKKAAGPNTGTYFLGWTDDALSLNDNRGYSALAQNTDLLDSLLRRRMATPTSASLLCVSTDTYKQLSGWVWCGGVGDTAADLFQIVEDDGTKAAATAWNGAARVRVYATDIRDAAPPGGSSVLGTGWVKDPYLVFAASETKNFKVLYGGIDSLAVQEANTAIRHHQFSSIPWELEYLMYAIKGAASGSSDWFTPPGTDLETLQVKDLNHAYRAWDSDIGGTPGAGATVHRSGIGVTVLSAIGADGESAARDYVDPINACFVAKHNDLATVGDSRTAWSVGSIGFATIGRRWNLQHEKDYSPTLASVLSLVAHDCPNSPPSVGGHYPYTHIPSGTVGKISPIIGSPGAFDLVLQVLGVDSDGIYPNPYFWRDFTGTKKTAISQKRDIIELTATGWTRSFLVIALHAGQEGTTTDAAKAVLYPLDGGLETDILADTAVTVRWLSTEFAVGHGSPLSKFTYDSKAAPYALDASRYIDFGFEGMYLSAPLRRSNNTGVDNDWWNPLIARPVLEIASGDSTQLVIATGVSPQTASNTAAVNHNFTVDAGGNVYIGNDLQVDANLYVTTDLAVTGTSTLTNLRSVRQHGANVALAAVTTWDTSLSDYATCTPTSGVASYNLALTNLISAASYNGRTLRLAVYRAAGNTSTTFNPSAGGFTMYFEDDDASKFSPTDLNRVDVYTGTQFGTSIFWTVARYTY